MVMFKKMNGHRFPAEDPTSIGCLAISKGYATPEQVASAVKKQEERLPLGQILIEIRAITPAQLEELLLEQVIQRKKLSPRKAAKLWSDHRRKMMRTVTDELRGVALALTAASKHGS